MLSGGESPCFPNCSIVKIQLQGKIDEYNTDDLIVSSENPNTKRKHKLLGQIKHSIAITKENSTFGEVIEGAWNDFNNPKVFTKETDAIALITGPLSKTDLETVRLLHQARAIYNPSEFFRHIETEDFCSNQKRKKLDVLRYHLMTHAAITRRLL